ncbi:MAG TPA: NUDIX hydrolase [Gaiellaceae bacterium]|nr:NUDIX hydrolase [Gaiellaceae bacterium]
MGHPREEREEGLGLKQDTVEAAGGVVYRRDGDGALEVLLVHRPRYDDWTLPKGKLHRGESHEEGALREVEEETGLRCELGRELPSSHYRDQKGRAKVVRYWTMRPLDGAFQPHEEVDDARWLTLADADAELTYDRDREILHAFAEEEAG